MNMSIKKDRVMQELQRFGGAMYTPVILFAFFGLTVAISIVCKNTMLLGSIADKGTVWYDFWFVVEQGAWTVFAQMPILFAIAVPIGFAKKEPARCAMESFVIYMCFNYFISAFLTLHGDFFGVDYSQAAGAHRPRDDRKHQDARHGHARCYLHRLLLRLDPQPLL